MKQQLTEKQITLINKDCANLYINTDTILKAVEVCIDWDVVDFSGKNKPVINSIKVVIKREEIAEPTTYRHHETPEYPVLQEEETETLDFEGDWTWNTEGLEDAVQA